MRSIERCLWWARSTRSESGRYDGIYVRRTRQYARANCSEHDGVQKASSTRCWRGFLREKRFPRGGGSAPMWRRGTSTRRWWIEMLCGTHIPEHWEGIACGRAKSHPPMCLARQLSFAPVWPEYQGRGGSGSRTFAATPHRAEDALLVQSARAGGAALPGFRTRARFVGGRTAGPAAAAPSVASSGRGQAVARRACRAARAEDRANSW